MAPAADKKILEDLRRPFTPAAVQFKIQSEKHRILVVSYIDARLVIERLNTVVGLDWQDEYEMLPGGTGLLCRLTVMGHTRCDVGEPGSGPQGRTPKALYSDAIKRAAVKFGIGVSLYALPKMFLEGDEVKVDGQGDRQRTYITYKGEAKLRANYTTWLEKVGVEAFGKPLDHGDVEGAAGDHEVAADRQVPLGNREPEPLQRRERIVEGPYEDQGSVGSQEQALARGTAAEPVSAERLADTRTPKQMAVDAFKAWVPTGQSKAHKAERETIKNTLAGLLDLWKRDPSTGLIPVDEHGNEVLEPDISQLPGTIGGIGEALYGLIGEAIQSRDECAVALAEKFDEKVGS